MVGARRWEAFFGIDDGDDMSDSDESSMTSDNMRPAKGKPGDDDDAKAEARSNKKVSCLKPKRPVVMPADG